MPEVVVRFPGLLGRFTEGERTVRLEAETVDAAAERLLERYPALEPHLYDQHGRLRVHVRLLVNGRVLTDSEAADVALESGDEVAFVQAVSGG